MSSQLLLLSSSLFGIKAVYHSSTFSERPDQSMTDIAEDERDIELESVTAIYPELEKVHSHIATLDIEVIPTTPLQITFKPEALPIPPPSTELRQPGSTERLDPVQYAQVAAAAIASADKHILEYLPSLHLNINLPQGYPEEKPPHFEITTSPSWLSDEKIEELEGEGEKLWEEYGRSQVVFAYIDYLQQEAERAFGLDEIILPYGLKAPLLSHDKAAKKQKFNQGTFSCGICLEPKKGSACHKLRRCSHVFCIACLQDTYNYAITEGDVGAIKCLDPDCGKQNMTAAQRRLKKQKTLHPNELLDIPIERAQVQRYADLKTKKKLESDKGTIYCPRKWCQGPARSLKYARYDKVDLEAYPESSDEDESINEAPDAGASATQPERYNYTKPPPDRLSVCSKCQYAFCRICQRSWHGEHINCLPSTTTELTAEEQASYDYIRLHTSACPSCSAPCQKTHGCNHMICFQCSTHYCYLCQSYLMAGDPYRHFNVRESECFMRLWELEEGDEGDNAIGGGGGGVGRGREEAIARRDELAAQHLREAEAFQLRELEIGLAEEGLAT